jgi:hypothetical protein
VTIAEAIIPVEDGVVVAVEEETAVEEDEAGIAMFLMVPRLF